VSRRGWVGARWAGFCLVAVIVTAIQTSPAGAKSHGADPKISPWVSLWKGAAKPLAVAAMIGAALVGVFHYLKVGPSGAGEDE